MHDPTPKCILDTHVIQSTLFSMVIRIGMAQETVHELKFTRFIESNLKQKEKLISCTFLMGQISMKK